MSVPPIEMPPGGVSTSKTNQWSALLDLPKFWKLVWATSPKYTLISIFLRVLKSGVPLALLYIGKQILDLVVDLIQKKNIDIEFLWKLVAMEAFVAVMSEILNRSIALTDGLLGDLLSNKTSVMLIEHAAQLDLYQFEDSEFYDKLERARTQTTGRTVLMTMVLEQFQDLVTIVFIGAGLIYFSPWLIIILLISVIPSFLSESWFNQQNYSLTRSWTPERRELDYLRFIGASDQTAKEVKIFGLEKFLSKRFETIANKYFHANKKLATKRAFLGMALSALGTLAYYGAYVTVISQAIAGAITIGTLTFLAGSFSRLQGLLQGFLTRFSRMTEFALYLKDWFEFFEIKPRIFSKVNAKMFPTEIKYGFEFKNVGFKYPGTEKWAIRNLTFQLHPGEKLALVGENGAGKTTLVKLLARLYEPNEGVITLENIDLADYDLHDLRKNIGIIFQDFVKFQLKASENIAIGNIELLPEENRVKESAHKSLADTVIEPLPKQYETFLGKRFHDGVELSGGQWQKVALARAYMRDASLLILDEPTSALDARAEYEVFLRFSELIQGKMAVLISHRFSTVRMADRILFLENGQLQELGTHEELIQKGGKYAELFHLQARGYA
jgi:ATP-binding cassette, subfamily B, bacterial